MNNLGSVLKDVVYDEALRGFERVEALKTIQPPIPMFFSPLWA